MTSPHGRNSPITWMTASESTPLADRARSPVVMRRLKSVLWNKRRKTAKSYHESIQGHFLTLFSPSPKTNIEES